MQESKVEKIICISKRLRRLQRVEEAKKESVVEAVAEGVWLRKGEGLQAGEFGGWLAGRCENRVFQQAQARRGTAGRSFDPWWR